MFQPEWRFSEYATVIGALIGAAVALYSIRRTPPRSRNLLKHDLEILRSARDVDLAAPDLKADVEERLAALPGKPEATKWAVLSDVWLETLIGFLIAGGLFYLGIVTAKWGDWWWIVSSAMWIVAFFFGWASISMITDGFKKNKKRNKRRKPS